MIKPPDSATVYENSLAIYWLDEHGILCAVSKRVPRSVEEQKEAYSLVGELTGNKKVCLLADVSMGASERRETREYAAKEMPRIFHAIGIVSSTNFGKMTVARFLSLNGKPLPIKLCNTEYEAKEWLKQFLPGKGKQSPFY